MNNNAVVFGQPEIKVSAMPAKEPLLETLKVCILELQAEDTVTDASPQLASCCELLELILRKGLQQPVLSLAHRDYCCCFEQLVQLDRCGRLSAIALAVQQTTTCPKLLSAQGRGRYFIRLMLSRKTLGNVVNHLLHTSNIMEWYSPDISVLRNEEFVEPFLSLCLVLSEMEFKLNIQNCSFLDESWLLPVCETYEAVPCRELGMALRYLDRRVFVLELLRGGVAQADMFAEPGDIIDEINGISLRNSSNGQAGVVLSRLKGQPLSLRLLRWRCKNGTVYRPLVPRLRQLKQENPSLQFGSSLPKPLGQRDNPSQCVRDGRILYAVQLLGKTNIGMYGGKEVLQYAIPAVLQKRQSKKGVLLDMKETHLTCTDKSNKQQLFQHHFPEISCVGRFGQLDFTIFAFCVGDTPDTGFCCVVLQAASSTECEEIVQRIGEEPNLTRRNCSFLDESWLLPVCETYEAVPCRELGMALRYLDRRVFVLELLRGGVAQADMFAEPGDIIDEINGISLRNSSNGQAGVVLSRLKGQPLSLRLLRWRCKNGTVYRPLVPRLRQLKQENPSLQFGSSLPKPLGQRDNPSQCVRDGRILYAVQLLGKTNIGMYGGKEVLQYAIPAVLQKRQSKKGVLLDMKETHLTCTDKSNKQQLFQHHFPEISCVGRFGQLDFTIFAFCVGDTPDTGFCCVVLQAASSTECEEIVQRIGTSTRYIFMPLIVTLKKTNCDRLLFMLWSPDLLLSELLKLRGLKALNGLCEEVT